MLYGSSLWQGLLDTKCGGGVGGALAPIQYLMGSFHPQPPIHINFLSFFLVHKVVLKIVEDLRGTHDRRGVNYWASFSVKKRGLVELSFAPSYQSATCLSLRSKLSFMTGGNVASTSFVPSPPIKTKQTIFDSFYNNNKLLSITFC